MKASLSLGVLALAILAGSSPAQTTPAAPVHVPAAFSGGHDTDPRDRGRPVILIAASLGVSSDVFRQAFSAVHPAGPGTEPDPDQVRRNKAALMAALGPYGVTDERLNAVSNHYRYNRSRGEMWPVKEAEAYAVVENGKVSSFVVTDGGSGYSAPPVVTVPGYPNAPATAALSFDKDDFAKNGAVASIDPSPAPAPIPAPTPSPRP